MGEAPATSVRLATAAVMAISKSTFLTSKVAGVADTKTGEASNAMLDDHTRAILLANHDGVLERSGVVQRPFVFMNRHGAELRFLSEALRAGWDPVATTL